MSAHDATDAMEHPWADQAPAYALGALDADERADFAAHLTTCARCQADVDAFTEVAAGLAATVPPVRAPARLRARILAEVAAADAPAPAGADVRDIGAARAARAAMPEVRPGVRRRASVAPWLAAAAALLLAAGLGTRWRAERTARGEAERLLADRTAALGARTAALAERDSLLAALLAPDVQTARLTATGAAPEVRVHWQRSRGVVVLTAQALPVPRPGRTYQLWGIPTGGAPQGLGTFQPAANGEARVVLRVPPGAAMDVAAITDEPSGGSPAPTTTPIVLGTFRSE